MKTKGDLLREEARNKFSPAWRWVSVSLSFIKKIIHLPIDMLRKRFPNLPHRQEIIDKLSSFSLKRKILTLLVKNAKKANNVDLADFFQQKLDAMDEVKNHIISKYVAKELFLYFFIAFLFFFMIFFVNQILLMAETILKKRVPVFSVIRLIWYSLPAIVAQSAPFATLVGFLMCLGRMVTDNEVLILRASGQRYITILKPVIIMGVVISLGSFVINDYFLPLGTLNYNKLYRQVILSNPAVELEPHSVKRTNDQTLVIGDVQKQSVSDLVFFDSDSNGNQRVIVAQNSDIIKSANPGVLMQLTTNDALVIMFNKQKREDYDVLNADTMTLNVFESSIISNSASVSPREMTSYDLLKKIKLIKTQTANQKSQLNTYKLEYNKKFSIHFGSFFFA